MKRLTHRQLAAVILVMSGLLAGTALPELMRMGDGSYTGFASMYALQKYEIADVQYGEVFSYILSIRTLTLLFLWMSRFTPAGYFLHMIFFWWLAVAAGMLLALFALKDGWHGLILFGCSLLPQWILYIIMWKRELTFLFEWQGNRMLSGRRVLLNLGGMLGLCCIGCVCEAFLGMRLIKFFLEIFK